MGGERMSAFLPAYYTMISWSYVLRDGLSEHITVFMMRRSFPHVHDRLLPRLVSFLFLLAKQSKKNTPECNIYYGFFGMTCTPEDLDNSEVVSYKA